VVEAAEAGAVQKKNGWLDGAQNGPFFGSSRWFTKWQESIWPRWKSQYDQVRL